MSGRRAGAPWRPTLAQQRTAAGVGVGLLVLVAAWSIIREDAPSPTVTGAVSQPVVSETTTPEPSPTVTVTQAAAPVPMDPTDAAMDLKPLRDLVAGDRVVYTAEPGGPPTICTWQLWEGSIATSTIVCDETGSFQVPTGTLGPVEARP